MFSFFALGALAVTVIAGYRLNMYLYAQGALKRNVRIVSPVKAQAAAVDYHVSRPMQELGLDYRDGTLRYARVGIMLLITISILVVIGAIAALTMVF